MKMQRLFLWMLVLPLIFISCQNDEMSEADDLNGLEETTELSAEELAGIKMCKDVYPEGVPPRAAAVRSKVWPNGSTLKVKLDRKASAYVREKVKQYAREWSDYANITFEFVTRGKADINVTFKAGGSYFLYRYGCATY